MLRLAYLFRSHHLGKFCRFKHIGLSPLADAFNYGPEVISNKDGKVTGLFGVAELSEAGGFRLALDKCFSDCHMLLYEAKDPNRKRKMVQVLDDLSDCLCRVADLADCVRSLHPDASYQEAANEVCFSIGNLVESLNTDTRLYEVAVHAASTSNSSLTTPEANSDLIDKRVLNLFIEDFEQTGVHLKDTSDRMSFLDAAAQNLELSVTFNKAAHAPVVLNPEMLSGISKDIDWTPFNGRRLFSPYYDASQPFLRALSYALFFGPIEGQEERLISLLEARDKLARAAGKASFLYRAVQPSSLAESPERVERFLKKVSYLLSPIATGTARSQLIKDLPNMDRLRPWDIPFLIHSGQQWIDTEV